VKYVKILKQQELNRELRAWSKAVIEKKTLLCNGLPVCPYAKKAWQQKRVIIESGCEEDWDDLVDHIYQTDFKKNDVLIYCDFNLETSCEVFDARIQVLNHFLVRQNLWAMGFHIEHDSKGTIVDSDFEPIYDEPYLMVFIQALDKLNIASKELEEKGYYKYWDKETFYEFVEKRRHLQNETKKQKRR
tara:strand:- start:477 stop:1040 length:564 start_codon:yes stop_codon:yes gene_type:complete